MTDDSLMEALRRDSSSENSDVRQRVARILMERSDVDSLNLLVLLAGDPDWRVRKAAIEGLEANPTEEVVKALIPALYDPVNAGRRNAAAEALRAFGHRALPYLLFELGRINDADSRIAIATVLGDISADESAAALVALLGSEDVNVASAAIVSLGRLARPETVPALIGVLSGDNAWLHYHAIETLGRLRATEALPAIVSRDQNPALKKAILEAAGSIGGYGSIDLLAGKLAASHLPDYALLRAFATVDAAKRPAILAGRERSYLKRKFRENAPSGSALALTEALKKSGRIDRKVDLLRALGWLGAQETLPLLIEQLSGDCPEAAARALEDFGTGAEPSLIAVLSPWGDEVKIDLALRLLSRAPKPEMLAPVVNLLDHDSSAVRRAAVELLARIADPGCADYLVAHLNDGEAGVDMAAVEALAAICRKQPEARASLQRRLTHAGSSTDPLTRANALSLLFETGSEEFRARVLAGSKDEDAVVRARAVTLAARSRDLSLVALFEQALADENPQVRLAAVQALSTADRSPRHREAVAALLQDDDLWVRSAAARALGSLGGPQEVEALVALSQRGEPPERIGALEALGRIAGPAAWEAILAALADPDPEIRQAALSAAAGIESPEAQDELDRRAQDPDWRLRSTALDAMGRRDRRGRRRILHRALREDPDDVAARSALSALEAFAVAEDIPVFVETLGRDAIADDVASALVRLRKKFPEAVEKAWREAEPRPAAILAEILRADLAP